MSNICLCRGVSEETIIKAVKDGSTTYAEVKEKTSAGTGGCRGGRCKCKIEEIIGANK